MIARAWHGRVPAAKAGAYYELLQRTGIADYRATPSSRGVLVQQRIEGDVAHFVDSPTFAACAIITGPGG